MNIAVVSDDVIVKCNLLLESIGRESLVGDIKLEILKSIEVIRGVMHQGGMSLVDYSFIDLLLICRISHYPFKHIPIFWIFKVDQSL